jgi:hypothetical protein
MPFIHIVKIFGSISGNYFPFFQRESDFHFDWVNVERHSIPNKTMNEPLKTHGFEKPMRTYSNAWCQNKRNFLSSHQKLLVRLVHAKTAKISNTGHNSNEHSNFFILPSTGSGLGLQNSEFFRACRLETKSWIYLFTRVSPCCTLQR